MLSLYQRELQDNVKYYKDFEENLRKCGWQPDTDSPHSSLEEFIKWMYEDSERKIKERFNKIDNNQKFKWIGINPSPVIKEEMSPLNLLELKAMYKKLQNKCMTTKWLQKVAFVMEFYTDGGTRPHFHMIAVTDTKPHRIIETFSKLFKCEKNMIDVTSCTFGYDDKLNYLKGLKTDSKLPLVDKDKVLRDNLTIPHLYNTL